MSPRHRGPALLELLDDRTKATLSRPRTIGSVTGAEEPAEAPRHAGPARTLRIPFGYLYFAAAGALAIFVLGWTGGYLAAQRGAESRAAERAGAGVTPADDPVLTDYLNQEVNPDLLPARASANQGLEVQRQVAGSNGSARDRQARQQDETAQPATQPATTPAAAAADRPDPNLNYLLVASFERDKAERAAEFLRDRGLPAVAIRSRRQTLIPVVILRGFPRETLSSPEAVKLRQDVLELGRIWRTKQRGGDFSGAYFVKGNYF